VILKEGYLRKLFNIKEGVSLLFKKTSVFALLLVIILVCGTFSVTAEPKSLTISYDDMISMIEKTQDTFYDLSPEKRKEKYDLIKDLLSGNEEIDELIEIIEDLEDEFFDEFFNELAVNKDAFVFVLCFIKSLPEAKRQASLEDFSNKVRYGITGTQATALKEVYNELLSEAFREAFETVHGRDEKVFLSLFSCLEGSFVLTDDKDNKNKIALKSNSVNVSFKTNLENNLTKADFLKINGQDVSDGEAVLKSIIDAVNSAAGNPMLARYKEIFEALGMYVKYTSPTQDTTTPSSTRPRGITTDSQPNVVPAPPVTADTIEAIVQFNDLPYSHWSAPYVASLIRRNVFIGYEDETFKPDQSITREEIAMVLVRALGLEERLNSEFEEYFADNTDIGEWSRKAVYLLSEIGIFSGYEDGLFRPQNNITRQELAVVIARALKKSLSIFDTDFSDNADIESWAADGIKKAFSYGIIKGYEDKTFRPGSFVSRSEAATMIYNFMHTESLL